MPIQLRRPTASSPQHGGSRVPPRSGREKGSRNLWGSFYLKSKHRATSWSQRERRRRGFNVDWGWQAAKPGRGHCRKGSCQAASSGSQCGVFAFTPVRGTAQGRIFNMFYIKTTSEQTNIHRLWPKRSKPTFLFCHSPRPSVGNSFISCDSFDFSTSQFPTRLRSTSRFITRKKINQHESTTNAQQMHTTSFCAVLSCSIQNFCEQRSPVHWIP